MTREQVVEAIRDPIMLFLEREFHMVATVESDRLADMLADLLMPLGEGHDQHAYSLGLGIVQERERIIKRIEAEYGSELVRTVSIGQLRQWVCDA